MRKQIWIPVVVVLAVCLLLLFREKQPQRSALPQPSRLAPPQRLVCARSTPGSFQMRS
jgi:hypothetical protein